MKFTEFHQLLPQPKIGLEVWDRLLHAADSDLEQLGWSTLATDETKFNWDSNCSKMFQQRRITTPTVLLNYRYVLSN